MYRRDFLTRLAAGTAAFSMPGLMRPSYSHAANTPGQTGQTLSIIRRSIEVNGRAASVFGLHDAAGKAGLTLTAGEAFDVSLVNATKDATLIHWHGLTPPWNQDGVPDNPAALITSGEARQYDFPVGKGGTHWMHAHTLQEQQLLAAPLIVRTAEDVKRDEQEIVVLLHDFSFKSPEELLAELQGKNGGHGQMGMSMGGMNHGAMMQGHGNMGMGGRAMQMDLNDIDYDAYLANDRTLDDPEIVQIDKGARIRLRIINGATATAFTIDTGMLDATLLSVDGQDIEPVSGRAFPMSMGQRIDLRLQVPQAGGVFPILAFREGALERTGIILASTGAAIRKISTKGTANGPVLDLNLEQRLRAFQPLAPKKADRSFALMLTGNMADYSWAIQGAGDGLMIRKGERVEVSMHNMSMMAHPMHLHGHHFQVVEINGARFAGAVRDTLLVPPMSTVTIAFDANNEGRWPLHCHHLYHMATGMMSFVTYDD